MSSSLTPRDRLEDLAPGAMPSSLTPRTRPAIFATPTRKASRPAMSLSLTPRNGWMAQRLRLAVGSPEASAGEAEEVAGLEGRRVQLACCVLAERGESRHLDRL